MKWSSCFLFDGLGSEQLQLIAPHIAPVSYASGEIIMEEGVHGDFALIVEEGEVIVYKNELKLIERSAGELVGLMSIVDGSPRSASVKAGPGGVKCFRITRDSWNELRNSHDTTAMSSMLNNYLVYQQNAIRDTNVLGLQEARAKLREESARVQSARFFVQMVVGLIIFTFALGWLSSQADQGESTYFSFGVLFIYAFWSMFFVRQSGIPREAFGLTMTNFRAAMPFVMWTTALFVAGMVAFKWALVNLYPETFGTAVISGYRGNDEIPLPVMIGVYCFHVVLQEFIARGCIQGGLHRFITGRFAAVTAIFLATMLFSVFHLMMDMRFALLTIVPGLYWGYLFYKHPNVMAVSISHIIIGLIAIFVLGIVG